MSEINTFQQEKRNFVSPSGDVSFLLRPFINTNKLLWNHTATVIFSCAKTACFRPKACLVLHWCLYKQTNQIDVRNIHPKTGKHERGYKNSVGRKTPHAAVKRDACFVFSYFLIVFLFSVKLLCCFWIESQTQNANKDVHSRHYSYGIFPFKRI